jgi:hypothetical protein
MLSCVGIRPKTDEARPLQLIKHVPIQWLLRISTRPEVQSTMHIS